MDHHLQNKLQQFSTTPPNDVWNRIAVALDAEENFAERLYQYEVMPPATAWQSIENSFAETKSAKTINFNTRFPKVLRYAAVAVLFAIVAITFFLSRGENEAESAETTAKHSTESPNLIPFVRQNETGAGKTDGPEITPTQGGNSTATNSDRPLEATNKTVAIDEETKKTSPVYSSLNKYVMFSDGDGKMRKISKKLVGLVNCKDNDLVCKQRLRELRQQMAAKAMTTDFTGVVELLRHMQ